jgi:L-seryl-tRNA(Ser) seleniumtransferase
VGGGAFPTARIPSFALAVAAPAQDAERRMRAAPVPVVGRIADGHLLLDLRSVPARDDDAFVDAVAGALAAQTSLTPPHA